MDRWVGKVAVVTGASSGIGAAIAEDLVKVGVTVVGLARRLERLEKLSSSLGEASGKLHVRRCDVRKEDELLEAFEWVNAELGGVDILVNNAGVLTFGKLTEANVDSLRNVLEVNVLATAVSVREAVASMKRRDVPGYIINVNSIVGHVHPPENLSFSLYTASKFAVTALTETVRKELTAEANNKIKITSLSPGVVRTEIIQSFPTDFLEVAPALEPKDISDAVLYVLGTADRVLVTELTIRPVGETL